MRIAFPLISLAFFGCSSSQDHSNERTESKLTIETNPSDSNEADNEKSGAISLLTAAELLSSQTCSQTNAGALFYIVNEDLFYHCDATALEFLPIDLTGQAGAAGADGIQGAAGEVGPQGEIGVQGEIGQRGEKGVKGANAPDPGYVSIFNQRMAQPEECNNFPRQSFVHEVGLDNGQGQGIPRDGILHSDEVDSTTLYCRTVRSPQMVANLNPSASSDPRELTAYKGQLYFRGFAGTTYGRELYKFDGNSISLVADIASGSDSSDPTGFTLFQNHLYFRADNGSSGVELFKFDGESVSLVENINTQNSGADDSGPASFAIYKDELYFSANDGVDGNELWKHDGTTTSRVADINPSGNSNPSSMVVLKDNLYFAADDGSGPGLFKYNGSQPPERLKLSDGTALTNPLQIIKIGDLLYMGIIDGVHGSEPYVYDGEQFKFLGDLNPGSGSSFPVFFTEYKSEVYFYINAGVGELWKYDGSETTMVADLNPDGNNVLSNLIVFDGSLYFSAYSPSYGRELWKHDGTTTTLVQDISSKTNTDTTIESLTEFAGALYFHADDNVNGSELWVYDGETAELVKDINPSGSSNPFEFAVFGDSLFMNANDGTNGSELWQVKSSTNIYHSSP